MDKFYSGDGNSVEVSKAPSFSAELKFIERVHPKALAISNLRGKTNLKKMLVENFLDQ
jgi:hypothetical protein